jgi:hypothetical protein
MSATGQLERLRKSAERGGGHHGDAGDLKAIEMRIKLLESYESLATTPGIADLLKWCRDEIIATNDRLSTERKVDFQSSLERLAIIEKRDVLLYLVGLFDPKAELESLETMLTEKAEEFEKYWGDQ